MNRPGDRVHCITNSYGYLVFPWIRGWLMWTDPRPDVYGSRARHWRNRLRLTDRFHNCRVTGIY